MLLFSCVNAVLLISKFKQNSSVIYLVKLNHRTPGYIKLKGTKSSLAEIKQEDTSHAN